MVLQLNSKKSILYFYYIFLVIFSFSINYWTASRGVFPIDTFLHFDAGLRILNNELPIRDYWIVHGLFVDYIQSLFFKIFGVNWKSYVIHSSLFNLILTIFSFKIFKDFNIGNFKAFLLAISFSILAYPVSGTPFLDLHSAFLSIIAVYFLILAIKNNCNIYILFSVITFGFAFLSKQVPAGYTIIGIGIYLVFYSYRSKSLLPIAYSLYGVITFFILFFLFLYSTGINFQDFFFQLITFPSDVGKNRYADYSLNLNNVFLNFKFIYFFLIFIFIFVIKDIIRKKKINEEKLNYFLIITIYTISLMHHQIFTKNQIFIFFIIPILCAFSMYLTKNMEFKKKNFFKIALVIVCIFSTWKYHERFNIDRKFHELTNTNLKNALQIEFKKDFFEGLNWISPSFQNPEEELKIIREFYFQLKADKSRKILLTNYLFFSSLLNEKLYSPSRTYDKISYPQTGNKYFDKYKLHFKNNIKRNKIKNIYIFFTETKIDEKFLKRLALDYLPDDCYNVKHINDYTKKIQINNCQYLQS